MNAAFPYLEDSGERLLPTWEHVTVAEHLHRYALAMSLAAGRRTLDLASGEGYGSGLLGSVAHSVLGVDRSAAAVTHATRKYGGPSVRFVQSDAARLPCRDAAFDLVVSFETIEHLLDQEAMLDEIRRVLAPEGILVMSSPERANHGEKEGYVNEFHVLELYGHEFLDLVRRRFPFVVHLRQQVLTCSALWPSVREERPEIYAGCADFAPLRELARPAFHLVLAGNAPIASPPASLFDGTELAEAYASRQATEIANLNAYVVALQAELAAREATASQPQDSETMPDLCRKLLQRLCQRTRQELSRLTGPPAAKRTK